MIRKRGQYRKLKYKMIRRRMTLLNNLWHGIHPNENYPFDAPGKYANNCYVKIALDKINKEKEADSYTRCNRRDQRQIDKMNNQMSELEGVLA